MLPSSTPSSEIIISDKKGLTKAFSHDINTYTIKKEVSKMDIVRVYNWHTNEVLTKTFEDPADADDFETILDFLEAEYERYHDGEQLY